MKTAHIRKATQSLPQKLLKCIQVVLTGHDDTEDISPDVGVHSLLPCQLQDLTAKLEAEEKILDCVQGQTRLAI